MSSAQVLEHPAIPAHPFALSLTVSDDQRKIRQAMRIRPASRRRPRRITLVRGATLLAGGFCLGWKAWRFWRH